MGRDPADRTLAAALAALPGGSTVADRLALVAAVGEAIGAVAAAHARGAVHGALAPAHVVVGAFGDAAVIGWPPPAEPAAEADEVATVDGGGPMRTASSAAPRPAAFDPRYAPVERVEGDAADARGDVYALGAMLYQVVAGRPPYPDARDRDDVTLAALRGPPRPLGAVVEDAPEALVAIVDTAMARRGDARYRDARALAAALHGVHATLLAAAPPTGRRARVRRWLRRHHLAIAIAGVAGIAAASVAGLVISDRTRARDDARDDARRAAHATTTAVEELGRTALLAGDIDRAAPLLAAAYADAGGEASPALRFLVRSAMRALDGRDLTLPAGAPVRALAFDRADRRLLVMRDAGVEQWSAISGNKLAVLADGDAAITTAQYPNNETVVIASDGDVVRLWDAHAGHLLHRLAVPDLRIAMVSSDGRRLLTVDGSGAALVRDLGTLEVQSSTQLAGDVFRQTPTDTGTELIAHDGSGGARVWFWDQEPAPDIRAVAWERLGAQTTVNAADNMLACGEHVLQVVTPSGRPVMTIRMPPKLASCAVDAEAGAVAASDQSGVVSWWRADDARQTTFRVGDGPTIVRWVAPGTLAVTAPFSSAVSIVAADTGIVTARFLALPGVPAAIGSTGRIALPRGDGSVTLTHVDRGRQIVHVPDSVAIEQIDDVRGRTVLSAKRGVVTVWDARASRSRATIGEPARLDATGAIAVGLRDGELAVLDTNSGVERARLPLPAGDAPREVDVAAAGTRVAIARGDGVTVWDVATRAKLASFPAVPVGGAMRLAGDGNRLATIAPDGSIAVYDVRDTGAAAPSPRCALAPARADARELPAEPVAAPTSLAAIDASTDGERIAVSTSDSVLVADLAGCALLLDAVGAARSLAFDRGGDVVAATDGEAIRVWRLSTHDTIARISTGHSVMSGAVALTSDGALVASGAGVWSVATGRQLAAWLIPGHHLGEPQATLPVERPTPPSFAAITGDGVLVTAAPTLGITTFDVSGESRPAAEVEAAVEQATRRRAVDGEVVPVAQ